MLAWLRLAYGLSLPVDNTEAELALEIIGQKWILQQESSIARLKT